MVDNKTKVNHEKSPEKSPQIDELNKSLKPKKKINTKTLIILIILAILLPISVFAAYQQIRLRSKAYVATPPAPPGVNPQAFAVSYPNGGETFYNNQKVTVKWINSGLNISLISIGITTKDDVVLKWLVQKIADTKSYTVTIPYLPNPVASGKPYDSSQNGINKIVIYGYRSATDQSPRKDYSDNTFKVLSQTMPSASPKVSPKPSPSLRPTPRPSPRLFSPSPTPRPSSQLTSPSPKLISPTPRPITE